MNTITLYYQNTFSEFANVTDFEDWVHCCTFVTEKGVTITWNGLYMYKDTPA